MMDDLISRQAAIDALEREKTYCTAFSDNYTTPLNVFEKYNNGLTDGIKALRNLPSAQPTLYGYKIEHLVYIAMVMEKEGVTAEYVVKKFDDISLIFRMIIEEVHEKIRETLNVTVEE